MLFDRSEMQKEYSQFMEIRNKGKFVAYPADNYVESAKRIERKECVEEHFMLFLLMPKDLCDVI